MRMHRPGQPHNHMKTTQILAAFVLAAIISPVAFADSDQFGKLPRELTQGDFCTNIGKISDIKESMFQNRMQKREDNTIDRSEKRGKNRLDNDDNRKDKREDNSQDRLMNYDSLRKQATTEAEKASVEKFISAVSAAHTIKQTAMDKLIASQRSTIDAKITEKTGLTGQNLADMKTKMDQALTKAKADCADGVDSSTVKSEFKKTLESARDSFKNLKDDSIIRSEMEALRKAHQAEIAKINTAFQTSLDAARAELVKAFPNAKIPTKKNNFGTNMMNKIKNVFKKKNTDQ
jgi:hypothetical protein